MQVGDSVRWQIAGGPPRYAVVVGQPAGAMDGFFVVSDARRSAIVHRGDCLVLPCTPATAEVKVWRERYLREHPGGLAP